MRVQEVIDEILRVEGAEYTNDPDDSGGPTKFGITQATLSEYRGASVTAEDVQELSEKEARVIYLQRYFDDPRLGLISSVSERIAAEVMDTGVNMGMAGRSGFCSGRSTCSMTARGSSPTSWSTGYADRPLPARLTPWFATVARVV